MTQGFDPLVERLLDGEVTLDALPPDLQAEGAEALRLLAVLDRRPVTLSTALDARVMAQVRQRSRSRAGRAWQWLTGPREVAIRVRVRPWLAGLAVAAAIMLLLVRPGAQAVRGPAPVSVRVIFYAPGARTVSLVGTFNQWDSHAAPLARTAAAGVWTTTLALPLGQHQYAFLVDGDQWVTDPGAPTVDDGFGQRNSVVAVSVDDGKERAL